MSTKKYPFRPTEPSFKKVTLENSKPKVAKLPNLQAKIKDLNIDLLMEKTDAFFKATKDLEAVIEPRKIIK